jgi:SAM-dependent methyltransferase
MTTLDPHRQANQHNWNDRVPVHAASTTYDLEGMVDDPDRLSGVVDFDRHAIGDVTGLRLVHLQCHIGSDTLSWARLGADVTGYDFSAPALAVARDLAARAGIPAEFVEGELYDAPTKLPNAAFDVVYTGTGALNWLPDVRRWADVVTTLLAPGGRLLIREGHPMLWALDHDRTDDQLVVATPYFETVDPLRWDDPGTYTDNSADVPLDHTTTYEWNHGIGEILTAVLEAGLVIEQFREHRELEWQAWGVFEPAGDTGRYVLPAHLRDRVPLMYTLVARKAGARPAPDQD